MAGNERAEGNNVNRVPDKVNAAITKQAVDATGMEGVQFVVGPSVVTRGEERAWGQLPRQYLIGGLVLVIGLAGDAVGCIGFGPPPVATSRSQNTATGRGTQTEDRAGKGLVVITLGIGAQVTGVAARVLPDSD